MKTTILVPNKIKVGFQERKGTYTGMLGYVIYHDGKVWRKQTSWENWRHKYEDSDEYRERKLESFNKRRIEVEALYNGNAGYKVHYPTLDSFYKTYRCDNIDTYNMNDMRSTNPGVIPQEYTNELLEGFVLNKKAGDYKGDWGNHRQAYARVYDPRGFEIEITIENLLYILDYASSFKGKGLEGKFIYGWDDKQLVLLPEGSPDFEEINSYNDLLSQSLDKDKLVIGGIYLKADKTRHVYLGKLPAYDGRGVKLKDSHWFVEENINKIYTWRKLYTDSIDAYKIYTGEVIDTTPYEEKMATCEQYKPKQVNQYEYVELTLEKLNEILNGYKNGSYDTSFVVYHKPKKTFKKLYVYLDRSYDRYDYRSYKYEYKINKLTLCTDQYGNREFSPAYTTAKELLDNYTLYIQQVK